MEVRRPPTPRRPGAGAELEDERMPGYPPVSIVVRRMGREAMPTPRLADGRCRQSKPQATAEQKPTRQPQSFSFRLPWRTSVCYIRVPRVRSLRIESARATSQRSAAHERSEADSRREPPGEPIASAHRYHDHLPFRSVTVSRSTAAFVPRSRSHAVIRNTRSNWAQAPRSSSRRAPERAKRVPTTPSPDATWPTRAGHAAYRAPGSLHLPPPSNSSLRPQCALAVPCRRLRHHDSSAWPCGGMWYSWSDAAYGDPHGRRLEPSP